MYHLHLHLYSTKLPFLLAYKTLDVEQFIKNNKSIESLRLSLSTLDEYYHKIVSIALDLQNENSALKDEIESLKKADSEIKATYKDSVSDLKEQQKERIALEKENKKLRSIIKKYVYPDIANELMAQDGLIDTDTIINKTDFSSKIIHSDTDITKVIALHNSTSGSDIITDMFLS